MIYAVEGNVNVGKTTFIKEFSQKYNLNIIEESKFVSDMNPFERQLYYIKQENEKRNKLMKDNKIIIQDKLFFIIYPFELINKNHQLLKKDKKTQETLVDYKYYLNYNMFFANLLMNEGCNIIKTEDSRQIIELESNKIYYNLNTQTPTYKKILALDGEK